MAKVVYYYERENKLYVREDFQSEDEGVYWSECPYNESQKEEIINLATSYTNALNSAEWLAEKEAKEAFLTAGDIICAFFSNKDNAKKDYWEMYILCK